MDLPARIVDLPRFADHVDAEAWDADIPREAARLFGVGSDVFRDDEGGVVVLNNQAMRELAQIEAVGNTPVQYLVGNAAERAQRSGIDPAELPSFTPLEDLLTYQAFTMNPPVHTGTRRSFARHLMPRHAAEMVGAAEGILRDVVEEAVGQGGPVDVVTDIAAPFVCRFWAHQLGLDPQLAPVIQRHMEGLNNVFLTHPSVEQVEHAQQSAFDYADVVRPAIDGIFARGENEMVAAMGADLLKIADQTGAPPSVGQLVASNFFDAFHTSGVGLANTFYRLFADPAALDAVRADPALVPAAFTEGIRLEAPLMLSTRRTLTDIEYAGMRIPVDTPVTLVWIAGNRDPRTFSAPDDYDLQREAVRVTTTFGGGAHICPGRNAARSLAEVGLRVLSDASLDVRLEPDQPGWVAGSALRHRDRIPVRVGAQ